MADGINEDGGDEDKEEAADERIEVVIEDEGFGGFGLIGEFFEGLGGGEEADADVGVEDLHER